MTRFGDTEDPKLEFEGMVTASSAKAIKFQGDFWDEAAWVPRSQIELEMEQGAGFETGRAKVKIAAWLCKKNSWTE